MTADEAKRLALRHRERGEFEAAAGILQEAIADNPGARELAQLWGSLGGTRRAQGDLAGAIAAYDTGAGHESADDTYNAVNRLVTRVLVEPRWLTDPAARPADVPPVDVGRALAAVQARLQRIVDAAPGDLWSVGDLVLTSALLGDADTAAGALDRWRAAAPPVAVRSRYRDMLAALAALDTPRKSLLAQLRDAVG